MLMCHFTSGLLEKLELNVNVGHIIDLYLVGTSIVISEMQFERRFLYICML